VSNVDRNRKVGRYAFYRRLYSDGGDLLANGKDLRAIASSIHILPALKTLLASSQKILP